MGSRERRSWTGRKANWNRLYWSTSRVWGYKTLGRAATGSRDCATRASRGSCSTRPNVSKFDCLYPLNSPRSACSIAATGICPSAIACAQHNGCDSQSNGLSTASGRQSQTTKKLPETAAIFANIKAKDCKSDDGRVKRVSIDCKATVNIGDYSRGGQTRGDNQASDHDLGCKEKYIPCGLVDEDSGQLSIYFGSSYKTSDFIVDTLQAWWADLSSVQQAQTALLQLKVDNGPESSGVRTQFLKRMVEFCDQIGKPIQLLYYPPYHSKYNPIERCWGILEQHWNGTQLRDVNTMLQWAQTMTWRGIRPIVVLNQRIYSKGISLSKTAMREIENRLERNPDLPKWDILIRPTGG